MKLITKKITYQMDNECITEAQKIIKKPKKNIEITKMKVTSHRGMQSE